MNSKKRVAMAGIMAKPEVQGRILASIICWLLGVGCLVSWNSIVTIQDYYQYLFPDYHSARVLPIVYEPVVLTITAILTYYETTLNTRKRIISGSLLVFLSKAAIIVLGLATSGGGGLGRFIGLSMIRSEQRFIGLSMIQSEQLARGFKRDRQYADENFEIQRITDQTRMQF